MNFKPKLKLKKAPRLPLAPGQVRLMLATFLRHELSFKQAYRQLLPSHFPEDMRYLGDVWGLAREHWAQYEQLPTAEILFTDVEQWVVHAEVDTLDLQDLDSFLKQVATTPVEEISRQIPKSNAILKQFLEEALQRDIRARVAHNDPVEMPELLSDMTERVQSMQSVGMSGVGEPFPEELEDIPAINKIPTGCDFLDKYLNGGQAAGEVYGLAAPYGVCKTLLVVQLSIERAKYEQARCRLTGEPVPIVYAVFYEEERASILARALSYAAAVDKTIIEEGRYSDMSSMAQENYKAYERKLFAAELADGNPVPGELDRIKAAKELINRNVRFIDFTGQREDYRTASADFVAGIEAVIEQDQSQYPNPPGVSMVSIDYAGAAADRHCDINGLDPTKYLRLLVGRMPLRLKNRVAVKHNCPVWCYHQLNTDSNSRSAGVAPKATDTADAKNFLENCTFGFMIGTKTKEDMVVMASRKSRRAKQQDETILQIEGALARVVGTGNMYRLDRGSIVKASERNRIAMPEDDVEEAEAEAEDIGDIPIEMDEFNSDLSDAGVLPSPNRKTL